MDEFILQCQAAFNTHGGIIASLFLAGLIGSATHCAVMCGPFVMAQVGTQANGQPPISILQKVKGIALLPYHVGRIITYMSLGMLAASVSQFLVGSPVQRGIAFSLLGVAGFLFAASAFPELKKLMGIDHTPRWVSIFGTQLGKAARPFINQSEGIRQLALGLILGLLPCGMVLAAIMAVASTGEPLSAAIGMAAFGVGTMPALVLVGAGASAARARWPHMIQKISTGVMAANGIGLMMLAGALVF
jgi:sulfite exporter TauE/SafE